MGILKNAYALIIGIEYDHGLINKSDAEDIARILKPYSLRFRK